MVIYRMEHFDLYNIDRLPTGKQIQRGQPIEDGSYYSVVHVLIFNGDKMLIQQRTNRANCVFPNLWDVSVGGHMQAGEKSRFSAQRELQEELGIDCDFSDRRPAFTLNFHQGFDDFYLINMNLDINDVKIQKEEVQAVKFATLDEICTMIDDNIFIPYRKELIKLCFTIKDSVDTSKIGASWIQDDK